MKEKIENLEPQPITEKKDIFELGQKTGTHKSVFIGQKILAEIWRDKAGKEIESAKYLYDSQGQIVSEEWRKEGKPWGRYIYQFDAKGKFMGKKWEDIEPG